MNSAVDRAPRARVPHSPLGRFIPTLAILIAIASLAPLIVDFPRAIGISKPKDGIWTIVCAAVFVLLHSLQYTVFHGGAVRRYSAHIRAATMVSAAVTLCVCSKLTFYDVSMATGSLEPARRATGPSGLWSGTPVALTGFTLLLVICVALEHTMIALAEFVAYDGEHEALSSTRWFRWIMVLTLAQAFFAQWGITALGSPLCYWLSLDANADGAVLLAQPNACKFQDQSTSAAVAYSQCAQSITALGAASLSGPQSVRDAFVVNTGSVRATLVFVLWAVTPITGCFLAGLVCGMPGGAVLCRPHTPSATPKRGSAGVIPPQHLIGKIAGLLIFVCIRSQVVMKLGAAFSVMDTDWDSVLGTGVPCQHAAREFSWSWMDTRLSVSVGGVALVELFVWYATAMACIDPFWYTSWAM